VARAHRTLPSSSAWVLLLSASALAWNPSAPGCARRRS